MNVLIVCNSGNNSSEDLKQRLEATLPGNQYATSGLDNVVENWTAGNYDVLLTFDSIHPYIVKAFQRSEMSPNIKKVEDFNDFAKDIFNQFLMS